jgi:hypothetical protein
LFNVVVSSQFKKDLKRVSKRGKDINKMENVVNILQFGDNLGLSRSLCQERKAIKENVLQIE